MSSCDLCGKNTNRLFDSIIEGTMVSVCEHCSKFGSVVTINKPVEIEKPTKFTIEEKETIELIDPSYSEKLKKAREQRSLTQDDLAFDIAEKTSTIHNLESGRLSPSLALAKKLEQYLNIKLLEVYEEKSKEKEISSESQSLTIGDLIKKKKQ